MSGIITIESEVPFGQMLYGWLYMQELPLNKVVHHDAIETHYLAWETVRKQINPFFQNGTGFEGYLISRCPSAESALEEILDINQNILDAIARLYRFQYGFRSRLMKTLTRDASDPEAIHIWSTYLGAALGKLRAQMAQDPQAQLFRTRTYQIVKTLPPMTYYAFDTDVLQKYAVGTENGSGKAKLCVLPQMLNPSQQDAWLVAEVIGEFGHPMVRNVLDHQAA